MAISIPTTLINGAENTGAINATVYIGNGGINSGTINGATTIATGGTNSSTGTITGNAIVSGSNAGTIIGNVRVPSGGQIVENATVTGTVLLEAGASNAGTVTGTLYVATGATNTASATTLILASVADGVTTVTTNGNAFTGVAYNLEGDGKAYSYTSGANTGAYTGAVSNLQADGEIHDYIAGVDQGVVALSHPYGSGSHWWDSDPIQMNDLIYSGQYTSNVTINSEFYVGTNGQQGYTRITTNSNGAVHSVYEVNHQYSRNGYYLDYDRLDISDAVYTGQYSSTRAVGVTLYGGVEGTFYDGNNTGYTRCITDQSGSIATKVAVDHQFTSNGSFYHDNNPLQVGDTVYTGMFTDNKAGETTFGSGTQGVSGYAIATVNSSGVVTSLVLVNHQYGSMGYAWDNNPLVDGDTVYMGQYSDSIAQAKTFYIGTDGVSPYKEVNTSNGGLATVSLVDHQYGSGSSWLNTSTPTIGSLVYTGQYSMVVATNANWTIGTDGSSGYAYGTTNGSGVIDSVNRPDHGGSANGYYWITSPLQVRDTVYTGRYTYSTANNATFNIGTEGTAGFFHVHTDSNGSVDTLTAVNHAYNTGSYYHDNATLQTGDVVYTGRYTDQVAANISPAIYIGTEGVQGYGSITTDIAGVATFSPVSWAYNYNIDGVASSYWGSKSHALLEAGDTVYSGQYTNQKAENASFYTGARGQSTNFFFVSVNSSGNVDSFSQVDHAYYSNYESAYWDGGMSPEAGQLIYNGRYTDVLYISASFRIGTEGVNGLGLVQTGGDGKVTSVTSVDNQYNSSGYYWKNNPLASGDLVYTGQYTTSVAQTATFYLGTEHSAGYARVTTDNVGTATVDVPNHTYNTGSYYYDNATLRSGDVVYAGQYTFQVYSTASFEIGIRHTPGFGHASTNSLGVATVTLMDNANSMSSYLPGVTYYYEGTFSASTPPTLYTGRYTDEVVTNPSTGYYSNGYYYHAGFWIGPFNASSQSGATPTCNSTNSVEVYVTGLNVGDYVINAARELIVYGSFAFATMLYSTDANGKITQVDFCTPYN